MLKDYLCHIANTPFAYHRRFYAPWDDLLCRLLEEGKIVEIKPCTVSFHLDGQLYEVWIANRWYAYAYLCAINKTSVEREIQFRPRFKTMRRLHALVSTLENQKEKRPGIEIYSQNTKPTNAQGPLMDINAGWLQRIPHEERRNDQ
ncbi:hypothetical protein [Serratia marcescens]|uniref:hypothetical protein n=1 Tax=Serratia marcescens TaxID=615 RepID=UPI003D77903A